MATQQYTSGTTALARVFWMAMGPILLVVLALSIVQSGSGWVTLPNIAYLIVLCGMLFSRWVEFKDGNPQTAFGEPATSAHLRKFVGMTLFIGMSVWAVANIMGNHLLRG